MSCIARTCLRVTWTNYVSNPSTGTLYLLTCIIHTVRTVFAKKKKKCLAIYSAIQCLNSNDSAYKISYKHNDTIPIFRRCLMVIKHFASIGRFHYKRFIKMVEHISMLPYLKYFCVAEKIELIHNFVCLFLQ